MKYVAINKEPYFKHHGILGQKWGKKNGPPYPLDYSKLSAAERAQDKQRAIAEGDVETVAFKKNRNYYTNQEINDVINRYQLNTRISQLNSESQKAKAGKSKVEEFISTMDTLTTVGNKLGNGIEAGTKVYNNVAKIMNAFGDGNLPIVGQSKEIKKTTSTVKSIDKISGTITETLKDANGNTTIIKNKYADPKAAKEAKKAAKAEQKAERKAEKKAERDIEKNIKKAENNAAKSKQNSGFERVKGTVESGGYDWSDYNAYQKSYTSPSYSVNSKYLLEDKRRR